MIAALISLLLGPDKLSSLVQSLTITGVRKGSKIAAEKVSGRNATAGELIEQAGEVLTESNKAGATKYAPQANKVVTKNVEPNVKFVDLERILE